MNSGRLAVMGLAAAIGIGTTVAILDYRNDAQDGALVELSSDDLEARTRDGEPDADAVVEDDDLGDGDGSGNDVTTRGGNGTGGKTTGGQRGDTTQNVTTHGGQGTGGKTTGGQRGDTTQPSAGGGVFFGGGGSWSGGGGGGSGSGGGT